MSIPMFRAAVAAAALPLAALAAADGTGDLRLGIAYGVATESDYHLHNAGESYERDVDDGEPLRLSAGYVHRFAAAGHSGPIGGLLAFYQQGPSGLDGPLGSFDYDLEATSFGFDLIAGYALALPPRLRLEGVAFGGYYLEQQQLRSATQDYPLTGDGWEAGLGAALFYALDERWDLGLDLRYLLLRESDADFGNGGSELESTGLLAGLVLAYRL
ncbi:MAG: hypothetical protein H0X45_03135 [Planctomycetes bacterium]|nr:hypothetical protein [Planctomycetota bacterium]